MARQNRSLVRVAVVVVAGVQAARFCSAFVGGAAQPGMRHRVALRQGTGNYESGKVNFGMEVDNRGSAVVPPEPVIECDTSCIKAIEECLDEGCSVEAMMALDAKLAEDEAKIAEQLSDLSQIMKTDPVPEAATQMAWLKNFLGRSGTLRAQLQTMKPLAKKSGDFAQQLIKAAAVAFGGGRETDYPKVGVSSYSD